MADVEEEVVTFAPAQCTWEQPLSVGVRSTPRAPAAVTVIISAEELQRAVELAMARMVADWPELAAARREARKGGGRLLDEIIADAARTPDDCRGRAPEGP